MDVVNLLRCSFFLRRHQLMYIIYNHVPNICFHCYKPFFPRQELLPFSDALGKQFLHGTVFFCLSSLIDLFAIYFSLGVGNNQNADILLSATVNQRTQSHAWIIIRCWVHSPSHEFRYLVNSPNK